MDKLGTVLAELAAKLGTTAEHLWPTIVKYRVYTTIGNTATALVAVIIGSILLVPALRGPWSEDEEDVVRIVRCIAGGITLFIGSIFLVLCLPDAIATIGSPEGATTVWLLSLIAR